MLPVPPRPRLVVAVALVTAIACTSCLLAESRDYVVQPAPPSGVHVTIRRQPTQLLSAISDLVTQGRAVDRALEGAELGVRCDHLADRRSEGDRCAFLVLRATRISGSLVAGVVRLAWNEAVSEGELGDFRDDAMVAVRRAKGRACLHVTLRTGTPVNANWTTRAWGSTGC